MASLQRTLSVILTSLLVGSPITTVGAAAFGGAPAGDSCDPLSRVAGAASELASGDFDTRLAPRPTPTSTGSSPRSTTWPTRCRAAIEREARFASDVSHELRSPITALAAAVEVLDGRRDDLPERSQKALDVVVSQVQRFDQMVLDLLEISRVDAGPIEMHVEPTSRRFPRPGRRPLRVLVRARRGQPQVA